MRNLKNRDTYNSAVLNDLLDRYPTFASLTNYELVTKQETAYIKERVISQLMQIILMRKTDCI